jgi:C-terminal processing protease CtpA/Prc
LDTEFLIYALDRGYAGRDFLPKGEVETLFRRLRSISGSMTTAEFHERIDAALIEVSDNHLSSRLNGASSKLREHQSKAGHVGKNVYVGDKEKPWFVEMLRFKSKSILVVSIVGFPPHESQVWKGFLETVESLLPKADAAILDFRGNGGGDDTMGLELAWLFFGRDFRYPYARQYERQTPETCALLANTAGFKIAYKKTVGEKPEDFFFTRYSARLERFKQALRTAADGYSQESLDLMSSNRRPARPLTQFKKPILILMDAECASSCESTIDGFEFHPMTKKIGERTAGYIHFGNVSPVLLPKSRVLVQIPTHYSEYADRRFLEKTGLAPDLALSSGEDAFEAALKLLKVPRR